MRSIPSILLVPEMSRWAWLAFCLATAVSPMLNAAETNAASQVTFPKSVFVHNDPAGKDPFFPNRQRGPVVVISTNTTPTITPDALFLKGFTGPPDKRIALINNLTFVKGEEQEVRIGTAKLKVKLVDIRDNSVIVTVEGQSEPKELVLPDKTLPISE